MPILNLNVSDHLKVLFALIKSAIESIYIPKNILDQAIFTSNSVILIYGRFLKGTVQNK